MKAVIFLLALLAPVLGLGQVVDGVNVGERTDIDYVELVGVAKLFSQKLTVRVDYGQKFSWDNDTRVEGPDGKPIVFNSMMDAVNNFSVWGWELMFAYDVSTGQGGGTVYHYVMRRKKG